MTRLPDSARIYECRVTHARAHPQRNVFSYPTYQWLADVDELPRLGPLANFLPADHVGDPAASIRQNLEALLATRGIDLHGGRITMLASARVLGYVFNPLTVYWCHGAAGRLESVVAEVHNTYRQRHCFLMRTDERGRATIAKQFYVSPFNPVDGSYRMSLPEPAEQLALGVTLHRPNGSVFAASIRGRRRPPGLASLLRAAARQPWPTAMVSARIRWQGIRLYARGLPVYPRPEGRPSCQAQEGR